MMFNRVFLACAVGVVAVTMNMAFAVNLAQEQEEFQITYPKSNSVVHSEIIELEGKGAKPKHKIVVSVLTNEWYPQDGKAEIQSDGTWSYAPCYLSGKGRFNNHTIKAKLMRGRTVVAVTSVRRIVRED